MRGYESTPKPDSKKPPSGYESPCGVMRDLLIIDEIGVQALRIPMRGYELTLTNDHTLL